MKKIFKFLITLFFISTLLFPLLPINKGIFAALVLLSLVDLRLDSKIVTFSPVIILLIFFYGFIIALFNNADRALSLQLLLSIGVLFMIFGIDKYEIDIDKIVKTSSLLLCVYTAIAFFLLTIGSQYLPIEPFSIIYREYSSGSMGVRDYLGDSTAIVFNVATSPFLFIPFSLYMDSFMKEKKAGKLFIILFIITISILSASRGLVVTMFIGLITITFFHLKLKYKVVMVAISIPIVVTLVQYIIQNTLVFSTSEESNSVKIAHLESFFDNMTLMNFLMGDGLGAYYYSKGSGILKAVTEVTPLDMLRYFGFILTPILYFALLFPSLKIRSYLNSNILNMIIFVLYLIFSMTNPILFNSFGLLVVLWYWAKILARKRSEISQSNYRNQ